MDPLEEDVVVDDDHMTSVIGEEDKSLINPSSSSTSNSGRATPKLKLTFKLPVVEGNSKDDVSVSSKGTKGKPKGKKTRKKDADAAATTGEASAGDHNTATDELRQFVRKMKSFRCRSWRLDHRVVVPCMALQRTQLFQVTAWVRERSLITSKPTVESTATESATGDTFVCALEGCHKIFDTKLKWKRHQAVHRKRAQKLLALSNTEPSDSIHS